MLLWLSRVLVLDWFRMVCELIFELIWKLMWVGMLVLIRLVMMFIDGCWVVRIRWMLVVWVFCVRCVISFLIFLLIIIIMLVNLLMKIMMNGSVFSGCGVLFSFGLGLNSGFISGCLVFCVFLIFLLKLVRLCMFIVFISLQWCFILVMYQCRLLVVFFMLVIIGVSRCGMFWQMFSLSIFGLIISICRFFGDVLYSRFSIIVFIVIDLFELVVLVISRWGMCVRLVMVGWLVIFLLSVRVSMLVDLLYFLECSNLDRQIILWVILGIFSFIIDLFGIILIICIDFIDRLCVMFLFSELIWLILMFGVGLILKCVIIGFGQVLIIWVLMWKFLSLNLIWCDRVFSVFLLQFLGCGLGLFSSVSGGMFDLLLLMLWNIGIWVLCLVWLFFFSIGLGCGLILIGLCLVCILVLILCIFWCFLCSVWVCCYLLVCFFLWLSSGGSVSMVWLIFFIIVNYDRLVVRVIEVSSSISMNRFVFSLLNLMVSEVLISLLRMLLVLVIFIWLYSCRCMKLVLVIRKLIRLIRCSVGFRLCLFLFLCLSLNMVIYVSVFSIIGSMNVM